MARVLIVSIVYEPDTVSTATIATGLARELCELGHDVGVLTSVPHYNASPEARGTPRLRASLLAPVRVVDEDGVRVARCFMAPKSDRALRRALDLAVFHLVAAAAVARHFRDREVVIVISPPPTLVLIGALARRLARGTLVYNVQELWPDVPRALGVIRSGPIYHGLVALEHWIYRSSDMLVPIGASFAEAVVSRGADAARIDVIPNFVDTNWIEPRAKDNALARRWGLSRPPVVLYAGNIGLTQDFDTLLAAADLLAPAGVQVLIVGGGAGRSALEQRLSEQPRANVRLEDFVAKQSVADLYGLADVIVVPLQAGHDRTTTPSKIFSAMAAGRPLLVTAAPDTDVARTVTAANAGRVVPAGDAAAMAAAVESLLAGGDAAWEPAAAAATAARHSPRVIALRYDRIVRDLAKAKAGGS